MARTFTFNTKGIESINGSEVPKGPQDVAVAQGQNISLHQGPTPEPAAEPAHTPDPGPDFIPQ